MTWPGHNQLIPMILKVTLNNFLYQHNNFSRYTLTWLSRLMVGLWLYFRWFEGQFTKLPQSSTSSKMYLISFNHPHSISFRFHVEGISFVEFSRLKEQTCPRVLSGCWTMAILGVMIMHFLGWLWWFVGSISFVFVSSRRLDSSFNMGSR